MLGMVKILLCCFKRKKQLKYQIIEKKFYYFYRPIISVDNKVYDKIKCKYP